MHALIPDEETAIQFAERLKEYHRQCALAFWRPEQAKHHKKRFMQLSDVLIALAIIKTQLTS